MAAIRGQVQPASRDEKIKLAIKEAGFVKRCFARSLWAVQDRNIPDALRLSSKQTKKSWLWRSARSQ